MSDEDRMDRARRIRQMRESGERAGDSSDEDEMSDADEPADEDGRSDADESSEEVSGDREDNADDGEGEETGDDEGAIELGMDETVAERFKEATLELDDDVGENEGEIEQAEASSETRVEEEARADSDADAGDTPASTETDDAIGEGPETDDEAETAADETDSVEPEAVDTEPGAITDVETETGEADTAKSDDSRTKPDDDGADESDGEESGETLAETAAATGTGLDHLNTDDSGISAPLPGFDQLEKALEETGVEPEAAKLSVEESGEEATDSTDERRVLEFVLGDGLYCLDIQYVEEILKKDTITRVPNTPEFVEGVVDLRGQITTILNPKVSLDTEDQEAGRLLVVFDDEAFEETGHLGWTVDDVRQVTLVSDDEVNEAPMDDRHVNGIIDRDGEEQFVVWTSPELAFDAGENA